MDLSKAYPEPTYFEGDSSEASLEASWVLLGLSGSGPSAIKLACFHTFGLLFHIG